MSESSEQSERRHQQDRRESGRKGKYDRRRNRCGHCANFNVPASGDDREAGFCQVHQKPFFAHDFACIDFELASN